ncbi:MAG: hypothetical protein SXQ77_05185 [Halobacteria archaeon]|nr:hypothetical protein [Halobacteria archaeon]
MHFQFQSQFYSTVLQVSPSPNASPPLFPFSESVFIALVSLVVGALGIYIGAKLVVGKGNYVHAVFTAVIGAVVWTVANFLFGWLYFIGPILTLLAWVWVIKRRYSTGWVSAGLIAAIAWISAIVVLSLIESATRGVTATGIPGL